MTTTNSPIKKLMITVNSFTAVEAKVIDNPQDHKASLNVLLEDMVNRNNMLVGFDIEWDVCRTYDHRSRALLKFCTELGCLILRLQPNLPYPHNELTCVRKFLASKDIKFACVHLKDDLERLQRDYGIKVVNPVELSELAASVIGKPDLVACGARELASQVLGINFDPRPVDVFWSDLCNQSLAVELLENAAIDVYAAYKVAEKILDICTY
ncbi:Protein RISC-INTERACTING CLEARING 3'-5' EXORIBONUCLEASE 1 [Linum perenne]